MYRSALTAPLFGFLLAATTVSHAASFSGSFAAVYPAEYGSSGALTIAGSGVSLIGSGVVSGGTLSVVRSSSGTLTLSEGTLAVTGNNVLSTGSLSGFSDSLGSLTSYSGSFLVLLGNSPATDQETWSLVSSTGGTFGDNPLLIENEAGLWSISFTDPNFLSSGSLSLITYQGINYDITGWTPVPEPSGGMLAIAGGTLLLTGRRRSRGTALPDGARSA
ncbi:hypothetical protein OVA24_04105 [Luteolibacter sp. SL250]|uniref:hypothetical protein n=1 Tax=Luteolibacter sp. SL250 TaxID=2995170 RepID=UPI00226F7321|nr:hypothetical protein [Luteolibacter sp. SL250]WAC20561.1 hypothetical protein OVA24_04105 [Luteolibacter sp. SL250]